METVNILQYNGNTVSDVNWRGNLPVSTLRVVTDNVEAEWSKGSVEPSFNATLYGLDTEGSFFINKEIPKTSIVQEHLPVYFSSGNFMLVRIEGENYGNLVFDTNNVFDYNTFRFNVISLDDKYAIIVRTSGFGSWQGGWTGNDFSDSLGMTYSKDTETNKKYYIGGLSQLDEFHTLLGRLDLCSKIIRIPSSGYSNGSGASSIGGQSSFELHPYTFMYKEALDKPFFLFMTRGENQLNVVDFTETVLNTDDAYAKRTKDTMLGYRLQYEINKNTTGKFREFTIFVAQHENIKNRIIQNTAYNSIVNTNIVSSDEKEGYPKVNHLNGCSMVHLVQEPYAKNRVYYGRSLGNNKFIDDNALVNASAYPYHAFFETCSSKVITSQDNVIKHYCMFNTDEYIAYPNDFDYEANWAALNATVVSTDYMWGEQSYTILKTRYSSTTTKIITFNRK